MTSKSGIRKILPESNICDFEFKPYGYSMKSIEGAALSTIHVTPEDRFSYASFETSGYDFKVVNLSLMIERVLLCFQPWEFSISLHTDLGSKLSHQSYTLDMEAYSNTSKTHEELGMGGSIVVQMFVRNASCGSPNLKSRGENEEEEEEEEEEKE